LHFVSIECDPEVGVGSRLTDALRVGLTFELRVGRVGYGHKIEVRLGLGIGFDHRFRVGPDHEVGVGVGIRLTDALGGGLTVELRVGRVGYGHRVEVRFTAGSPGTAD
jgi:hypothetical protein